MGGFYWALQLKRMFYVDRFPTKVEMWGWVCVYVRARVMGTCWVSINVCWDKCWGLWIKEWVQPMTFDVGVCVSVRGHLHSGHVCIAECWLVPHGIAIKFIENWHFRVIISASDHGCIGLILLLLRDVVVFYGWHTCRRAVQGVASSVNCSSPIRQRSQSWFDIPVQPW